MHDKIFFQFFKHFWFPQSVGFLLLKSLKIFTVGKILYLSADHHAGWPLCKLWEHRARSIQPKFRPVRPRKEDHLKRPVFSKLFRLDRTDPLSLGPKFAEFWLNGSRPSFLGPRPRLLSLLPSLKREREFCVFTPPTQRHRLKFLDVAAR